MKVYPVYNYQSLVIETLADIGHNNVLLLNNEIASLKLFILNLCIFSYCPFQHSP